MKKPCNVLMVTGIFPPDEGGPASYVPRISKELVKLGSEVEVITLSDTLYLNEKYSFKIFRIKRSLLLPLRWLKTTLSIFSHARKYDVIYANGLYFETLLASIFLRKPYVCKVVGDTSWERSRNKGLYDGTIDEYQSCQKRFKSKVFDIIRDWPLIISKQIIVPSHYLKKIVMGWGIEEEKIKVIYNALPEIRNETRPVFLQKNSLHVVTVARLVPWKGVDGLIEAVSKLSNSELTVVGDGPMMDSLIQLAKRLNVEGRVHFKGKLNQEDAFEEIKKGDVFVLNSSYEGLPHVVLESMLIGVPVIATNVGGTPELVKNLKTGLLIEFGNQNQLIEALRIVMREKDQVDDLVQNAKAMVENEFSYKKMLIETSNTLYSYGVRK